MNALMKIALCYEVGPKREKKPLPLVQKVAMWRTVKDGAVKQPKKIKQGDIPLHSGDKKKMQPTKKKPLQLTSTGKGEGRKMDKRPLKLDAGTGVDINSGRKMMSGQPSLEYAPKRQIKQGDPNLKGGLGKAVRQGRNIKQGDPRLWHGTGGDVKTANLKKMIPSALKMRKAVKKSKKALELRKKYPKPEIGHLHEWRKRKSKYGGI